MIMLVKAIELTLFPAVMAFAASSDLFTMTIANWVSIILVAGFGLLAALTGMGASDLLSHVGAAAAVLTVATPNSQPRRRSGSVSPIWSIICFTLRCSAAR